MAKKIKLTDIKVKSFNNILNKDARKATKGGYYNPSDIKNANNDTTWTANTIVDIREPNPFSAPGNQNKKGKLSNINGLNP